MSFLLRVFLCSSVLFGLGPLFETGALLAYPGRVDVRVLAGADEFEAQARDLEQTLFALVYSKGGKIASGFDEEARSVTERAQRALEGISSRLRSKLAPTELRDLQVAADTVEQHFRAASTVIDIGQWSDLVRVQAILFAKMGKEPEARERFVFFYNLQPDAKPEDLPGVDAAVKSSATVAHRRWTESVRGKVLLKGLPEGSRVFVDGKPVKVHLDRVSGLRSGLHLVQILIKGGTAFGAVVNVSASGIASISLPELKRSAARERGSLDRGFAKLLLSGGKLSESQLRALQGSKGADALLFAVVGKGESQATEMRGIWIHPSHEARYFSLSLKQTVSMREAVEKGVGVLFHSGKALQSP